LCGGRVVVLLRLVAIQFFLQIGVLLLPQVLLVFDGMAGAGFASDGFSPMVPILLMAGFLIAAVLIFVFAQPMADAVTRGVSQDLSVDSLSLADCYSIAFMGIGLYYAVGYLSGFLTWSHFLIEKAVTSAGTSWREEIDWYQVLAAYVPFLLGTVLFVKGRGWGLKLARRDQRRRAEGRGSR